ncbi:TetR/AcrR family transcriptional regulator [Allosalinactinospora lopnorensis]|uniref:TetR/AcrR family transcriptional regulator n=1 Tax=Allosalinactinospora lopnorensis TaxID=1352348 RepID=UPI000623FE8C|nr:TetR family transcriptional regulator [Allosalinactinospora lopnorensis]
MARTGRRPGATRTREQILKAAREQFAEAGYDGATIREIARRAGVDPALVHHFFGSKEQIFVAAMRLPFNPAEVVHDIVADPERDLAEGILRFFLGVWENPETRAPLLAFFRSATTNDKAAAAIRGFIDDVLVEHIAAELGVPPMRAGMVGSQLFGIAMVRYVVGVDAVASADSDDIVRIYAPAIRAVLGKPE